MTDGVDAASVPTAHELSAQLTLIESAGNEPAKIKTSYRLDAGIVAWIKTRATETGLSENAVINEALATMRTQAVGIEAVEPAIPALASVVAAAVAPVAAELTRLGDEIARARVDTQAARALAYVALVHHVGPTAARTFEDDVLAQAARAVAEGRLLRGLAQEIPAAHAGHVGHATDAAQRGTDTHGGVPGGLSAGALRGGGSPAGAGARRGLRRLFGHQQQARG